MQPAGSRTSSVTLLTTQEVQRLIKVDRTTIYRMAAAGRLPAVKVGRQWRFPEDLLHEWLRSRQGPAAHPRPPEFLGSLGAGTLQAVSDLLGDTLGAMVVLTDLDGRPLVAPSNPCGLFAAVHEYPGVLERCVGGWRALAAEVDLEPHWRVTPLGFLCARSLVRQEDRLIGMVVAGGIRPPLWPPDSLEAERLSAALGVPAALFGEHAGEVHTLDAADRDRVLRLLPRVAAFLSRLSAQHHDLSHRLEAIAALAEDSSRRSES